MVFGLGIIVCFQKIQNPVDEVGLVSGWPREILRGHFFTCLGRVAGGLSRPHPEAYGRSVFLPPILGALGTLGTARGYPKRRPAPTGAFGDSPHFPVEGL
jgi:hypothetical protein